MDRWRSSDLQPQHAETQPDAERVILFDEQREEFERFYVRLMAAFKPQGLVEIHLSEHIAISA
jgi:hypothetical protein